MDATRAPCVLVLKADVLSERAFASLAAMGGELDVVVSDAFDVSELLEDIFELRPDAVFLSEATPWADRDALSKLLIYNPGMKLVIINEQTNWLQVIRYEDRLLTSLHDLLLVIHSA